MKRVQVIIMWLSLEELPTAIVAVPERLGLGTELRIYLLINVN